MTAPSPEVLHELEEIAKLKADLEEGHVDDVPRSRSAPTRRITGSSARISEPLKPDA